MILLTHKGWNTCLGAKAFLESCGAVLCHRIKAVREPSLLLVLPNFLIVSRRKKFNLNLYSMQSLPRTSRKHWSICYGMVVGHWLISRVETIFPFSDNANFIGYLGMLEAIVWERSVLSGKEIYCSRPTCRCGWKPSCRESIGALAEGHFTGTRDRPLPAPLQSGAGCLFQCHGRFSLGWTARRRPGKCCSRPWMPFRTAQ